MSRFIDVEYELNKNRNYKQVLELIKYLNSFPVIAACPGNFKDPYTGESFKTNNVYGDGKYEWHGDLPILVEKYEVYIDEDFLKHAGIE